MLVPNLFKRYTWNSKYDSPLVWLVGYVPISWEGSKLEKFINKDRIDDEYFFVDKLAIGNRSLTKILCYFSYSLDSTN